MFFDNFVIVNSSEIVCNEAIDYISSVLNELTRHCYAISRISLSLSSPSFADDIALLALHPTSLTTLMSTCTVQVTI